MTRAKPLILAIEDDVDFRKALESILSRFGTTVKGVSTPEDFIKQTMAIKPDLFLIDLQLDQSSGFDLIKKLRQDLGVTKSIVVISGNKDLASISHAIELGANDYILKPLDKTMLASKLSRFFDTDQLQEHRSAFHDLPQGRVPAKASFKAKIVSFDELGLTVQSSSLIPKGTAFKLSSEIFKKFGAEDSEQLVTVISSSVDPVTKLYSMYAEFDGPSPEFIQALRQWLTEK